MVTSLPVTELLSGSIFTREARFAYHISAFRLAKIYVPFGDVTEEHDSGPVHPEALTEDRKEVPPSFPSGRCWGGVKRDQAFRFLVGQPQHQAAGARTPGQRVLHILGLCRGFIWATPWAQPVSPSLQVPR